MHARDILDAWSLILPPRIASEDLGGFTEEIAELARVGVPGWKIYLRTIAAIFWTGLAAVRYAWSPSKTTK